MGSPWYRSLVCPSDSVTKQIKAWNSMANLGGGQFCALKPMFCHHSQVDFLTSFEKFSCLGMTLADRNDILMAHKGMMFSCSILFGIQVCPHFSGTPLLCNSLIAIAWDSCFSPRMFAWLWHVVAKTAGFPGWKFTSSKTPTRSELSESISALSGGIVSPWNGWRMEITGITDITIHYWPTDLGSNAMELYGVIWCYYSHLSTP